MYKPLLIRLSRMFQNYLCQKSVIYLHLAQSGVLRPTQVDLSAVIATSVLLDLLACVLIYTRIQARNPIVAMLQGADVVLASTLTYVVTKKVTVLRFCQILLTRPNCI